jgi:hypothetical protein
LSSNVVMFAYVPVILLKRSSNGEHHDRVEGFG